MSNLLASVLILLGLVVATVGAFWVAPAAGVVAAGVSLVVFGYLGAEA